jgi:hypothetical protein
VRQFMTWDNVCMRALGIRYSRTIDLTSSSSPQC